MSSQDFIARIVKGFVSALLPLEECLESPEELAAFLANFGWNSTLTDVQFIQDRFGNILQCITSLKETVEALEAAQSSDANIDDLAKAIDAVITAIQSFIQTVRKMVNTTADATWPEPFNRPEFWLTFPQELVDFLLYDYLELHKPGLLGGLSALGIAIAESPTTLSRGSFIRHKFEWNRLIATVTDPSSLFAKVYGWGTTFKQDIFLENLAMLFRAFEFPVGFYPPTEEFLNDYYLPDVDARRNLLELRAPLYWELLDDDTVTSYLSLDLVITPIPPSEDKTGATPPVGFVLFPLISGQSQADFQISDAIGVQLKGGFESVGSIRVEVRPGSTRVRASPTLGTSLSALTTLTAQPASPWTLIGTAKSSRVELAKAHIGLSAKGPVDDIEYQIELGADSATLIVDFGESDGFLQKLLGGKSQRFDLSFALLWSNKTGFHFKGQAKLEANLPVHLSIGGIITVDTIHIVLRPGSAANSAVLQAALTGGLRLGPIAATVDRVGLQAELVSLDKTKPPGNLGDINISFGFKPPDGAGLALDAKAVTGGGYLFFDSTNEQYAGVLQLEIQDVLALKAIGLLTTRLPDGSKGFSLLVIISAEFPPIQLGFGFVLTGVGGLFGANRTMVLDVLRAGIKNRTLDSVLFPKNPVANAAKIISDLQSVFPPVSGRFVFGPMAILGWGTPTLLTVELGIVLELPSPVRLAIMGQLKLAMPDEKAAVVILCMDVLGTIDFGKSDASIDATIYDSRVAQYTISGDMAMRLNWGASPAFALSAGGFNPRFQPPPDFPSLARLAISLATGDNPRLRLEAYLALTTNTVQFGARLDAYAELDLGMLGKFTASAYLGFDALVHFPPFSFVVDVDGAATIKRNGDPFLSAWLHLTLSGPQPWHAYGEATFDLLGKQHITIDVTAGAEAPPQPLPPGDPLKDLQAALKDIRNWSAQLPSDGHMLVTLRQIPVSPQSPEILMHPLGELAFHQKVVPLDTAITRYGSTTPISPGPFSITRVTFNDSPTEATRQTVRDLFAPGQFFQLTDDEQLSRSAFESLPSGCNRIGTSGIKASQTTIPAEFEYETVVIDKMAERLSRTGKGFEYSVEPSVMLATAAVGAAGQPAMRTTGGAKFAGSTANRVKVREPEYAVSSKEDMTWDKKSQASYTEAEATRKAKGTASKQYQVVGTHEVA